MFLNIVLAIFIFSCFTLYSQCLSCFSSTGNRSCDMLNWNIYSACKQLLSCAQSFPSPHRRQTIRKSRLQFVLLLHFRCGTSFSALSVCNQLLLSLLLLLCTSLTFSFLQWQIEKAIQTNPIAIPPETGREGGMVETRQVSIHAAVQTHFLHKFAATSAQLATLPPLTAIANLQCKWRRHYVTPPPPSTFLPLSIPAKQHESPKCLAHNFCVWFCFVFLIKSTRRHSPLFSSLLSSLSAFSTALFSLALPPLLARLRIRLLDIFVCCAAKCEKVAINFVSVAFNGPT